MPTVFFWFFSFLATQSTDQDDDTHSLRGRANSTQFSSGNVPKNTVADWGTSFEKLLEDAAGLHTFAVFLQKEFSAENIYFWTACERYRFIDDHVERSKVANVIFSRHLGVGASEPVNVDSKARNIAQDNLNYADRDLFVPVSVLVVPWEVGEGLVGISFITFSLVSFTGTKTNIQFDEIRQLSTIHSFRFV